MAILISGASGFLGTRLVARLAAEGREIFALTRGDVPEDAPRGHNIHWVTCDLSEQGIDATAFADVDAVVHLAGTGWARGARADRVADESFFVAGNELTTVKLLDAFCKKGVRRFVLASSQVVYGSPGSLHVDESFPLVPTGGAYACSKINSENWMRYFHEKYGGTFRILRFCGFVDCGGVVDYFIDQALSGQPTELFARGEVKRDYLASADGVAAIVCALDAEDDDRCTPYNIGSGQALSTAELATIVTQALGVPSNIVLLDAPAPQTNFVYDIGRAQAALGFQPGSLSEAVIAHALRRASERSE